MRPLSLTALTLCLVSSSLGAPTWFHAVDPEPPRTTIETIHETVTRTVVHEVTEPATPEPTEAAEVEGSGQVEEVVPEQSGLIASNVAPGVQGPCPACVCNCNFLPATSCCAAQTANPSCGGNSAAAAASDSRITEISGPVKMCTCEESDTCRKESSEGLDECIEQCDGLIETYGDKTTEYRACFAKNNATIVEAENCLFDQKNEYCNNSPDIKFIERAKWDEFSAIEYSSTADQTIKDNYLWNQHGKKYTKFQKFFHCTKHCLHNKFRICIFTKGCAVKMPSKQEFAEKMRTCTKQNPKISTAIISTCQCLAWTNGVKDLQGACVTMGNQYFVDRA